MKKRMKLVIAAILNRVGKFCGLYMKDTFTSLKDEEIEQMKEGQAFYYKDFTGNRHYFFHDNYYDKWIADLQVRMDFLRERNRLDKPEHNK